MKGKLLITAVSGWLSTTKIIFLHGIFEKTNSSFSIVGFVVKDYLEGKRGKLWSNGNFGYFFGLKTLRRWSFKQNRSTLMHIQKLCPLVMISNALVAEKQNYKSTERKFLKCRSDVKTTKKISKYQLWAISIFWIAKFSMFREPRNS